MISLIVVRGRQLGESKTLTQPQKERGSRGLDSESVIAVLPLRVQYGLRKLNSRKVHVLLSPGWSRVSPQQIVFEMKMTGFALVVSSQMFVIGYK